MPGLLRSSSFGARNPLANRSVNSPMAPSFPSKPVLLGEAADGGFLSPVNVMSSDLDDDNDDSVGTPLETAMMIAQQQLDVLKAAHEKAQAEAEAKRSVRAQGMSATDAAERLHTRLRDLQAKLTEANHEKATLQTALGEERKRREEAEGEAERARQAELAATQANVTCNEAMAKTMEAAEEAFAEVHRLKVELKTLKARNDELEGQKRAQSELFGAGGGGASKGGAGAQQVGSGLLPLALPCFSHPASALSIAVLTCPELRPCPAALAAQDRADAPLAGRRQRPEAARRARCQRNAREAGADRLQARPARQLARAGRA